MVLHQKRKALVGPDDMETERAITREKSGTAPGQRGGRIGYFVEIIDQSVRFEHREWPIRDE